jgi:hypothetical protein
MLTVLSPWGGLSGFFIAGHFNFMPSYLKNEHTYDTEENWKDRLANILQSDYGHTVFTEVSYRNGTDKGRIDLYVITNKSWRNNELMPIVGIECKILSKQGMGWLINSAHQMQRYMQPGCIYYRDGKVIASPSICLVATPESWHEGYVYKWPGAHNIDTKECCWKSMNFIFEHMLMKHKCSVLLKKHFHSNIRGGAIETFYLSDATYG